MQHIVVLLIDSGDPSVTDFHHGLFKASRVPLMRRQWDQGSDIVVGGLPRAPRSYPPAVIRVDTSCSGDREKRAPLCPAISRPCLTRCPSIIVARTRLFKSKGAVVQLLGWYNNKIVEITRS
jgi:hypothetical protein